MPGFVYSAAAPASAISVPALIMFRNIQGEMEIRCQRAGACFREIKVGIVNRCFKQSLGGIRDDYDSSTTACRTRPGESKHHPAPCTHSSNESRCWAQFRMVKGFSGCCQGFFPEKHKRVFETPTPLLLLKKSIRNCLGIPRGNEHCCDAQRAGEE